MSEADHARKIHDSASEYSIWDQARTLIERLEGTTVRRLSVKTGSHTIEIERDVTLPPSGEPQLAGQVRLAAEKAGPPPATDHRHLVVAPLVGIFYRAPKPGASPFVEEGDVVDAGQTVCIVEAMKFMNNVSTPQAGRILEILVDDGDWVEFEQVLMSVEPLEGEA